MMGWIVSSSVLIAAVALLRRALRGRISLRLQYALWALVLLRLLIPFQFGSTLFSVGNLTERVGEQPAVQFVSEMSRLPLPRMSYRAAYGQVAEEYARRGVDIAGLAPEEYSTVDSQITDRMLGDVTPADVLRWVWLAGGAALALTFLACNLRFARRLKRSRRRLEDVSAPLPVYLSDASETPCLFGLLRPAVYLTPEAAADGTVLRHALEHELTHFRHRDHVWSLLRCLCLAVHWYNPLVWLAASLSRRDGELACDEGTLARLGEAERAAYGNTLIDLTCGHRAGTSLFYTATSMDAGKKQLKERIMLIAKRPNMLTATAVAVILIAAVAVGCTFTGGRGETQEPPEGSAAPAPSHQLPRDSGQQKEPLSYEEYFSQLRTYQDGDVIWGWNMEGAELEAHGSVQRLIDTSTGETIWDIVFLSDFIWRTADENWIYGINDQSELVRVDYSGQEIQTLFTDKTGLLRALAESDEGFAPVYLADGCTLFFLAGTDDAIGVYRLYLPERKLDVLYDAIPVDAIRLSLAAPVSNAELRWSRGNPDFFTQYKALTSDPASGYDPAQMGESECIGMLELDSGMFSACECYYNAVTRAYYEMPFGYVYLEMPRTQEEIASHGEAWWLDFAFAEPSPGPSGEPARALTQEEIERVNEAFCSTREVQNDGYTMVYATPVAAFFTSYYSDVRELDFEEFLRYYPAETGDTPVDEAEFQALTRLPEYTFRVKELADMPVPVHRHRRGNVDRTLRKYAGITSIQLKDTGGVPYLPEYEAWYNFTSDFGPGTFVCTGGRVEGDTAKLWSGYTELTLVRDGDNWYIKSFLLIRP